jgi:tetratricopeptide (TPR) repeat protein
MSQSTVLHNSYMRFFLITALVLSSHGGLAAQSSSDHVALGDKDYVAMNASAALTHYEQALAADPRNFDALWKASRSAVDIGSYLQDAARRSALFATAEQYARRAIAIKPTSPEGHFALARALGKTALAQSVRARVKYATSIRLEALECLKYDPTYAGCLHVMGMWNAEVMRLNGFTRMMAKNFLGGKVFGSASWPEARRYMEESVANEPNRIVHHLDLAGVYRDMGDKAKALAEYQAVMKLPNADYNDGHYKGEADAAMRKL